MIATTTRNATLTDLVDLLKAQDARKIDVVANANALRLVEGDLRITGCDPILGEDGVTDVNGLYRPTAVCDRSIASRLGIPQAYYRTLRETPRPDLLDANVNGLLHGRREKRSLAGDLLREGIPGDSRNFLVRTFRGDADEVGIARAVLSDRYNVIDNYDVLLATLDGIKEAGIAAEIHSADLTESRMYVKVVAPEVQALAPTLLRGYRSPFSGERGEDCPVVFAGFRVSNSEVGHGRFTIVPELRIKVCDNGLTITADALSKVHLGARMDEGIRWSTDTEEKNLALVKAQTRDAVASFLDVDYVTRTLARIEEKAHAPVDDPAKAVQVVAKRLGWTQSEEAGILDHFIKGGRVTAGGIMQAITSYSQVVDDADAAADLNDTALAALDVAASL